MFNNRQKQLFKEEVELYKKQKYLEIDQEAEAYMRAKRKELHDLAVKCAVQIGEYEHTFHSKKESLGIELSKLEAQIKSKEMILQAIEETINANKKLMLEKDAEIQRLYEIIKHLILNIPKTIIKNQED